MLTESTVVHRGYRVLQKIARGEVGEVYKTERKADGGVCALKVLNPEWMGDSGLVRRFKREAERARALRHPNAVRVEEVDEAEDGRPFVVMEYIAGETLGQVMARDKRLPHKRACSVARQVAAVLEVAHAQGIVHQDITPGHIILAGAAEREQVKLLGCCIASLKEHHRRDMGGLVLALKHAGSLMGTPEYFSPEMAAGKRNGELNGRSDLYSLGVVLYQMLGGELPFEGRLTPMDAVLAHLLTPPRPLRGVPDELASLVMSLLAKKPDSRPAGAREVVEALESVERLLGATSAPTASMPRQADGVADAVGLEALGLAEAAPPEPPQIAAPAPPAAPEVALNVTSPDTVPCPASPEPVPAPTPLSQPLGGGVLSSQVGAGRSKTSAAPQPVAEPRRASRRWSRWLIGSAAATLSVTLAAWLLKPLRSRLTSYFERTPAGAPTPELVPKAPAALAPSASPPTATPASAVSTSPTAAGGAAAGAASEASASSQRPTPAMARTERGGRSGKQASAASSAAELKPAAPKPLLDRTTLDALTAEGDTFFERGDYDRAIDSYSRALRLDAGSETLRGKIQRARNAKAAEEKYLNE